MKYLLNIKFNEENQSLINIYWIYYKKKTLFSAFLIIFSNIFLKIGLVPKVNVKYFLWQHNHELL